MTGRACELYIEQAKCTIEQARECTVEHACRLGGSLRSTAAAARLRSCGALTAARSRQKPPKRMRAIKSRFARLRSCDDSAHSFLTFSFSAARRALSDSMKRTKSAVEVGGTSGGE